MVLRRIEVDFGSVGGNPFGECFGGVGRCAGVVGRVVKLELEGFAHGLGWMR
jgi:hypothetical protein